MVDLPEKPSKARARVHTEFERWWDIQGFQYDTDARRSKWAIKQAWQDAWQQAKDEANGERS